MWAPGGCRLPLFGATAVVDGVVYVGALSEAPRKAQVLAFAGFGTAGARHGMVWKRSFVLLETADRR